MQERLHLVANGQGWLLELRQYWNPETLDPTRRPVLMIPGYCMNTFILNFHPSGASMVRYLVDRGAEVWTANLRGQGGTRRLHGSRKFGFREVALIDVPEVLHHVQANRLVEPPLVDAIGCSLGATFLFSYLAHHPQQHGIGSLVSMGGPLRWENPHPLLTFMFKSPELAGVLPIRGTRRLAKRFLPFAKHLPFVLDIYMNKSMINLDAAEELVKTVDDPIPYLNQQIAHWVTNRDLNVADLNITHAMSDIQLPTLCVVANADGIVPKASALSITDHIGGGDIEGLDVGDDLFINDEAQDRVFEPLSNWLIRKNS